MLFLASAAFSLNYSECPDDSVCDISAKLNVTGEPSFNHMAFNMVHNPGTHIDREEFLTGDTDPKPLETKCYDGTEYSGYYLRKEYEGGGNYLIIYEGAAIPAELSEGEWGSGVDAKVKLHNEDWQIGRIVSNGQRYDENGMASGDAVEIDKDNGIIEFHSVNMVTNPDTACSSNNPLYLAVRIKYNGSKVIEGPEIDDVHYFNCPRNEGCGLWGQFTVYGNVKHSNSIFGKNFVTRSPKSYGYFAGSDPAPQTSTCEGETEYPGYSIRRVNEGKGYYLLKIEGSTAPVQISENIGRAGLQGQINIINTEWLIEEIVQNGIKYGEYGTPKGEAVVVDRDTGVIFVDSVAVMESAESSCHTSNPLNLSIRLRYNHAGIGAHGEPAVPGGGSNATSHSPCEIDDNCEIDESCVDGLCKSAKLVIAFLPYSWGKSMDTFSSSVEGHSSFLLETFPIGECPERLRILEIHENCEPVSGMCKFKRAEQCLSDHYGLGKVDFILAMNDNLIGTSSANINTQVAHVNYRNKITSAHELGHHFGLEDQYCYNPPESTFCNGGPCGPNPIREELDGCSRGWADSYSQFMHDNKWFPIFGWFHALGEIGDDDFDYCKMHYGYDMICTGNLNEKGGRTIMGKAGAQGPRDFDKYEKQYLASIPQLNCSVG